MTIAARIAELAAELDRQRAIEARNAAKALSPLTPPRSRFANAAHATKARGRANRIERELAELVAIAQPRPLLGLGTVSRDR